MKIFALEAGNFKSDGGTVFGVVPKILWQRLVTPDPDNFVPMKSRSLLIDTGDRKILIDTGLSNIPGEKYVSINRINFNNGTLLENLEKLGYGPEQITDIIHTHLHHDHCGNTAYIDDSGNVELIFPNADIWVGKTHWQNVKNPNIREKAAFLPVYINAIEQSGKLKLIESDGHLFPGIEVQTLNGHTQGMLTVKINVNGKYLFFASDFIPTAHHIYEPYIMSYDICAQKTLEEKQKFFEWAENNQVCVFLQHDPDTECATIIKTEKGHKAGEKFPLSQWLETIR